MQEHKVLTIINVTPDSFFSQSRSESDSDIEQRISEALEQGADMIDIGGYSSRPGAAEVDPELELRRVSRGVEILLKVAPQMPFSVDTFRASVARGVIERYGPCTINDISAGAIEPEIIDVAAQYDVPYILMHSAVSSPLSLHPTVDYRGDVAGVVGDFLLTKAREFSARGVKNIILDPGFGFSKSIDDNFSLLKNLSQITSLPYPVLVGLSRKSFIYKSLSLMPHHIEAHTAAIHWQALCSGAAILRTHDTKTTKDIVRLYERYDRA